MRKIHKLAAWAVVLVFLLSLSNAALAHDVPDFTRKGSITVSFDLPEDWYTYGTLTLIRVGDIADDNGSFYFQAAAAFADCGYSFEDVQSPDLAQQLADYASENAIEGVTQEIHENEDGTVTVTFSDLELGLYLAVQNKGAYGYRKLPPFLISTPYVVDGSYVYDVDAKAKSELEQDPTTFPTTTPTDPTLPQTGQYNWPVPVMAVLGVSLIAIGWILRTRKRESDEA